MSWKKVKLVDICKPKQWQNIPISELSSEGYPVYGANGIIGFYKEYNHLESAIAVTCRGATCGTLNITQPKSFITSNAMVLDDIDESVDMKFLYYSIKNRGLNDVVTGAAQPQITRENLKRVKIPLPPLEKQIQIATVLSKAENLIAKRKQSIELLDEFVKSTFLQMFGDPFFKNKNPVKKLAEIVVSEKNAIVDGPFGSSLKESDYYESGIPIIRINNIRKEGLYDNEFKYINEAKYNELIRSKVEFGDILIARVGNTIGKTSIFNKKYKALLSTTGVAKATIDPKIANILFISTQMKLPQYTNYIWKQVEGGGQPYLNLTKIKAFKVIVPPLPLQNQFAEIVNKVEVLKAKYQKSLEELENLYASLSQRAFRGEL